MSTKSLTWRDTASLAQRCSGIRIALMMLPLFWLIYLLGISLEQRRAVQRSVPDIHIQGRERQ